MSTVTVEAVLDQAKRLSAEDQRRLARLLASVPEIPAQAAEQDDADPFAGDAVVAEWREAMKRAENVLGLHSTEEIMSHVRGRPWRFDD